MSKGFVVATDSRTRTGEALFLANQRIVQDDTRWWTNDLREAMVYHHRRMATHRMNSIQHNNPRVMSYEEADKIARKPEVLDVQGKA